MTTAIVVAGGDVVPEAVLDDLPEDAWVVAADSGADHARRLGLSVDVIIGDLDSVDRATLEAFPDATVHEHPVDKDATDLELALHLVAAEPDVSRVVVVGGAGGRLDHFLANVATIASPSLAHVDVVWIAHPGRVTVVHDLVRLHGSVGEHVSLVPIGGDVLGVRTTGLRWPLHDETLTFGSSRGVSNELAKAVATVSVGTGVLLAVQPTG